MIKILIIRFSSIGDIVLTTPVVRCLYHQIPGVEIHYLTKKQYEPLLRANPYIKRIHLFEGRFGEIIPPLREEKFDFVVDLHRNVRTFYTRLMLLRPYGTFSKLNLRKLILVIAKINLLPDIHIVDRYFRAVRKLRVVNDGQGLDYFCPPEEKVPVDSLPPAFRQGYIVFAIGGKHQTKIYPANQVTGVCRKLPLPVILLGGPEDFETGEQIAAEAGDRVFNGCGKWTVNQSASVIEQAASVITNDTGMMHIASAFRKRVISIWGNTVPSFGMYPYLPEGLKENSRIIEVKGLSCRPCSKLGYGKCPKGHFNCMKRIDSSEIIAAL